MEQHVKDLVKSLSQLTLVEREQSNTMVDMSSNLAEICTSYHRRLILSSSFLLIGKLDKAQGIKRAGLAHTSSDKGADTQKDHAKFMYEEIEVALKVGSAANTLSDIVLFRISPDTSTPRKMR